MATSEVRHRAAGRDDRSLRLMGVVLVLPIVTALYCYIVRINNVIITSLGP